jgi:hypothetical protein
LDDVKDRPFPQHLDLPEHPTNGSAVERDICELSEPPPPSSQLPAFLASKDRPTIVTIDRAEREWHEGKTIHVTLAALTIGIGLSINTLADPTSSTGSAEAGGIIAILGSIWMFLVIADHLWRRPGQPSLLLLFIKWTFFRGW